MADTLRDAFEKVLAQFDVQLDPIGSTEEERENWGDYSEIISKTQDKIDELSVKSQELLEKSGMTRDELEAYVSNPNNFSTEQWRALEQLKRETEEFKQKTQIATESAKQNREKGKKKQAHRFAKKKNWIPL